MPCDYRVGANKITRIGQAEISRTRDFLSATDGRNVSLAAIAATCGLLFARRVIATLITSRGLNICGKRERRRRNCGGNFRARA